MIPVITIDGPSGAGKGAICRLVAETTGYQLLDSGALYRLTALAALNGNVDLSDEQLVAEIARHLNIEFKVVGEVVQVMLDDSEVTQAIRAENVGMTASKVAAYPAVRAALLDRQRAFQQLPGLVADGRDMGTVVFPDAPVKIFLTASAEERAQRRMKQLAESGVTGDFQKILEDIEARDYQDRNRASAPLKPADDAVLVDSTGIGIEQVLEKVLNCARQKGITDIGTEQ